MKVEVAVPNSPYVLCRRKATVEVVFLVLHVSGKTKCSAGQLSFNLDRGLHFCLSLGLQKIAWHCTQCSLIFFLMNVEAVSERFFAVAVVVVTNSETHS